MNMSLVEFEPTARQRAIAQRAQEARASSCFPDDFSVTFLMPDDEPSAMNRPFPVGRCCSYPVLFEGTGTVKCLFVRFDGDEFVVAMDRFFSQRDKRPTRTQSDSRTQDFA